MKSPGHRDHPDHKVIEKHLDGRITVEVAGKLVADSKDVIEVDEDGYPARFYFPRSDIRQDQLVRTESTSQCPFKGTAHYYSVRADGRVLSDAAWTYEEPYDEHAALKDRVAFWDDKVREIGLHKS
jgi:uncharacterized protein (DUF427 family)